MIKYRTFAALFLLSLLQYSSAELRLCAKEAKKTDCRLLEAATSEVKCVIVEDSVDCLNKLDAGTADFGVFTAEEALVAAADKRDLQVIGEVRHESRSEEIFDFRTVAVVKKSHEGGLLGLKGKNYCHPGFSRSQYWTDPVLKAFENSVISASVQCVANITTIETETKALSAFFNQACRPGSWIINSYRDAKLKSEYKNLCALCDSPYECNYNTQQLGAYDSAMQCLTNRGGDVVYNALGVVQKFFKNQPKGGANMTEYSFLCPGGEMQALDTVDPCTWVRQPWPAILASTRNANTINGKMKDLFPNETARVQSWPQRLRSLLVGERAVLRISKNSPLETVTSYIGKGRTVEMKKPACGEDVKWCTTNAEAKKKCLMVSVAAATHGLSPRISCPPTAANVTECLKFVNQSDADIAVIPTNDGFVARRAHNLQPVMYLEGRMENYNGIIVVSTASQIKSIADLKNKKACFPSFNGLGWLTYMRAAWDSNLLPSTACPSSPKTLEFFGQSCVPGVNAKNINVANVTIQHTLCDACNYGVRGGNCESSTTNPYYGELGALRCLADGAGEVAFLDFKTAIEVLKSRRHGTQDANINSTNVRVLCKDGSKVELKEDLNIDNCVRYQVVGYEIVTRKVNEKSRFRDIQFLLENINSWFGTTRPDPIIKLFGKFNNIPNALLPSHGVDLVNKYETEGSFVSEYANIQSKLQHCSSAYGLFPSFLAIASVPLLLLLTRF